MWVNKLLSDGRDALLEFIFPSCCLICNNYIEKPGELVCPSCWNKIETFDYILCGNCEQPLSENLKCANCVDSNTVLIAALGRFVEPLGEIIRHFKYRKYHILGISLANRLIEAHSKLLNSLKIDFIVPIPLHSYRLKMRGYNQSLILADNIGKRLGLPVAENALVKIKHNKYQKSLDPLHRDKNVRDVYRASEKEVEGKRIMLVDDVITTGATLREAQRVLADAGGKVVITAVIAVAGR
jgi:competence protein ComFC